MTDLSPLMRLIPLIHFGTFRRRHLNEGLSEELLKLGDTGLDFPKNLIGSKLVAVNSCSHPELGIACHVHPVGEGGLEPAF